MQDLWKVLKRILRRDLPPGPRGFPFLGYLPFMFKDGHWEVDTLRKKYGNIFGLHLGSRYVVFLCDYDSVKEALSHNALLCRPEEFPLSSNPQESLITLNGPIWQEQRRFFLKMFKELGAGTPVMEAPIQKELSHLLDELNARNGNPVIPLDLLTTSVSNILTMLLASRRFGRDHPQRAYLNEVIQLVVALSTQVLAVNFFPWLRSMFSCLGLGSCGRLRDAFSRRTRFTEKIMSDNEGSYQEGTVRNFADGFISKMRNRPEGNETFTRKRSCPGESIANMVVFVYFTNILHHFTVEPSTDGVQLNDEVLGITMRPKPRELVFKPRKLYR
ncbi:hypothetical protein MTO96_049420 [Rhipicephalus appendiculatus]